MFILGGLFSGFIAVLLMTFIRMRAMREHKVLDHSEQIEMIKTELSAQRVATAVLHLGVEEIMKYRFKILVIDDEPDTRFMYELRFRKQQSACRLFFANGVEEAKAMFNALRFDLCIVDLKLKDGNGMEIIHSFINISPSVKFIVVTAYATEAYVMELQSMNIPIIEKPINDFRQIYVEVRNALHGDNNSFNCGALI